MREKFPITFLQAGKPIHEYTLEECSYYLQAGRTAWWNALLAREYVWAAYYANDLEALTRRLVDLTHKKVEHHYADPKAALASHPRTGASSKEGDRG